MVIHLNNYEEFILDYLEENLSPEQERAMKLFLKNNPQIANEIEGIDSFKLMPEHIVFEQKATLYKKQGKKIPIFFKYASIACLLAIITTIGWKQLAPTKQQKPIIEAEVKETIPTEKETKQPKVDKPILKKEGITPAKKKQRPTFIAKKQQQTQQVAPKTQQKAINIQESQEIQPTIIVKEEKRSPIVQLAENKPIKPIVQKKEIVTPPSEQKEKKTIKVDKSTIQKKAIESKPQLAQLKKEELNNDDGFEIEQFDQPEEQQPILSVKQENKKSKRRRSIGEEEDDDNSIASTLLGVNKEEEKQEIKDVILPKVFKFGKKNKRKNKIKQIENQEDED